MADAHLKQQRFLSFTFYKCFDHIFEIKKKENNAALLTLITDANLKTLLYTPLHNFKFGKKKCSVVEKRLFLLKFFHELCKKWNLKGNSIKLSTFLKYGLTEVKKPHS